MNIIVLTNEPFPIGMAATNRILSISKGIVENSHWVKVIILQPTEKISNGVRNKLTKGTYNGIEFEYSSGVTIWPKSKVNKGFCKFKGIVNAIRIIYNVRKTKTINCFLLFSVNSFADIVVFYFVTKVLKIKYIQEKSEFPFVLYKKSFFGKIYARYYIKYIYKCFDGMIIMTKPLYNFFKTRVKRNAKLIIVPMTVEPERFANNQTKVNELSKYIAYCGYMGGNKDGVPILIDAFKIVSNKYDNLKLYLIGYTSNVDEFNVFKQKIKDLGLDDKIVFTGKVNRDDIPAYLCNASLLVLARPSSLQSEGGFPTKLGEYLATGNPVVVTRVGEIPDYLTDGVTAFLANPDSAEAFAEKIDYVLSNPSLAQKVALAGRDVAFNTFNYRIQSKKIIDFVEDLQNDGTR